MYLTKIAEINEEKNVKIDFEKVVDDLLMISIGINEENEKGVLNYWRLTKAKGIPPLEMGVSNIDGLIYSIVFYVDSDFFQAESIYDYTDFEKQGCVVIDTSIFKKNNDYIDIQKSYKLFLDNDRLLCGFDEETRPDQIVKNNRLGIWLVNNQIIGFEINNLSQSEILAIKSVMI